MTLSFSHNALVLFSGGQDSATCLAWALQHYKNVETIGFIYGQRHIIELQMRPIILNKMRYLFTQFSDKFGEDHIIDLSLISNIVNTALTSNMPIKIEKNGLLNTFVPGRNLLFIIVASMIAYHRGLDVLVTGICENDYSHYPDCRDDTIKALQIALNLGMAMKIKLETPLMWFKKSTTWQLAYNLGGQNLIDLIRENTHTCYLGIRNVLHDWGYGCGSCPACNLRSQGYWQYINKYKYNVKN